MKYGKKVFLICIHFGANLLFINYYYYYLTKKKVSNEDKIYEREKTAVNLSTNYSAASCSADTNTHCHTNITLPHKHK